MAIRLIQVVTETLVQDFVPGTLSAISPGSAQQGQDVIVTITGSQTHFTSGITTVSINDGSVKVGTVTVASTTLLTVALSIAGNATVGADTITVTTGTETPIIQFWVNEAPPPPPPPAGPSPCQTLTYYLNLFTSEYQLSPNLLTWASAPLNLLGDACQCSASFTKSFDLDQAVGPQLDILGVIVGQSRIVDFDIAENPSIAVNGNIVSTGTSSIQVNGNTVATPSYHIGINNSVPFGPALDDTTYQLLLRAKILKNNWTGTIDALNAGWKTLFPGGTIIIDDNEDMTATILMSGSFSPMVQNLITQGYIVPRPEAVLYNYTFATLPVFGFDLVTSYLSGFDLGKWS